MRWVVVCELLGWRGSGKAAPPGRYGGGAGGEAAAVAGLGGGEGAGWGGRRVPGALRLWASLRPFSDKFQHFDWKVPQIQFMDRVLACRCAAETCTHSANCAADRRNSSGAVLGAGLDMPVVVHRQVRGLASL